MRDDAITLGFSLSLLLSNFKSYIDCKLFSPSLDEFLLFSPYHLTALLSLSLSISLSSSLGSSPPLPRNPTHSSSLPFASGYTTTAPLLEATTPAVIVSSPPEASFPPCFLFPRTCRLFNCDLIAFPRFLRPVFAGQLNYRFFFQTILALWAIYIPFTLLGPLRTLFAQFQLYYLPH
ncbi:uncharacterized protein BO97DRAFT_99309 [Aspergillus homomorphus CBS 101889]|uniref:Uncharacterized protein n=1 Tax=Aspergillus homomorphus (strain CBS 101889) TaxID=1450537 RepID=A0A395HV43_ASPHC|nr:hypothetical protein BO97DRAFT_99309 [Aspergillus homomorphus CBS 101889]RAL11273.1 hypothetical protein BO97DRAFT_99309 [Aspergillus homomorphus CBS 101889]